jgi:hypothetical protein
MLSALAFNIFFFRAHTLSVTSIKITHIYPNVPQLEMGVENILERIFSENENILRIFSERLFFENIWEFSKNKHLRLPEHFKVLENIPGPYCQCVRTAGVPAELLTVF